MDEIPNTQQPHSSRADNSKLRSGFVSITRLQAIAYFLLLIVAFGIQWNRLGGSSWGVIIVTALHSFAFGQLMLAAVATVFGPWNLMSRLTIPPLLIWLQLGVSMAILVTARQASFAVLYSSLGIGLWAVAQLPLWVYRCFTRYRLAPVGIAPAETNSQFSIGQLLYLTFVVAVLLSLGRLVLSVEVVRDFFSFRSGPALIFALLAAAITAITLLALKATLLNRRGWADFGWITVAVCFVAMSLFMAVYKLDPPGMSGRYEKLTFATSVIGQYFWMAINLHELRAAGWRLVSCSTAHSSMNRPLQSPE